MEYMIFKEVKYMIWLILLLISCFLIAIMLFIICIGYADKDIDDYKKGK